MKKMSQQKEEHNNENSNEKEPMLNELLKSEAAEWCRGTTAHGLANIVDSRNFILRTIWILITATSFVYCTYSVVVFFQSYFEYGVNIDYQSVVESPMDLPAITICNLQAFDLTTDSSASVYINKALIANNITPSIQVSSGQKGIYLVERASSILKASVIADKTLNSSSLQKLGFSMDTMLISCYYNGDECYSSNFTWSWTFDYGSCYTFNAQYDSNGNEQDSIQTSKSGPTNGLRLELFVGAPGKQDFYTIRKGVYVVVHDREILPLVKYEGVTVETGTASSISVSKTMYTKQPPPYSSCRSDVDTLTGSDSVIFEKTLNISKYTQQICYEICLQERFIIPKCSCADPSIPITDTTQKICSKQTDLDCVTSERNKFDTQSISAACDEYCKLECDSTEFTTSISASIYPTDYYLSLLKTQKGFLDKFSVKYDFNPGSTSPPNPNTATTNTTDDDITSSVLMLSVFYEELRYTSIDESIAITTDALVGVLGGQFGLFMGASFLTFAEVCQLIYDLVRITIVYRRKKKSQIEPDLDLEKTNKK